MDRTISPRRCWGLADTMNDISRTVTCYARVQWLRAQCLKLNCLGLYPSSSTYQLCVLGQVNFLGPSFLFCKMGLMIITIFTVWEIKWIVQVKYLEQCEVCNKCSINVRNHYPATEGRTCRLTISFLLFVSFTSNASTFHQFCKQNPFKGTIWTASLFLWESGRHLPTGVLAFVSPHSSSISPLPPEPFS